MIMVRTMSLRLVSLTHPFNIKGLSLNQRIWPIYAALDHRIYARLKSEHTHASTSPNISQAELLCP